MRTRAIPEHFSGCVSDEAQYQGYVRLPLPWGGGRGRHCIETRMNVSRLDRVPACQPLPETTVCHCSTPVLAVMPKDIFLCDRLTHALRRSPHAATDTTQTDTHCTKSRRRRRFHIDNEVRCVGAHPPFQPLEPAKVKPN